MQCQTVTTKPTKPGSCSWPYRRISAQKNLNIRSLVGDEIKGKQEISLKLVKADAGRILEERKKKKNRVEISYPKVHQEMLICGLARFRERRIRASKNSKACWQCFSSKSLSGSEKEGEGERESEREREQEKQTTKVARIFRNRRSDRHLGTSHLSTERIDLREIFGSLLTLLVGPKRASHPLRKCAGCVSLSVKK